MIHPHPLKPGDSIGICSPAGPVKRDRLEKAITALEKTGFQIRLSPTVYGKDGFLSASDEIRGRELQDLFLDPEIDAVFCSRGGSGTGRLLELVDTGLIAASRKPFLGFSDITALQWALFAKHGFVSYTGPLAVEWDGSVSDPTIRLALRMLQQETTGDILSYFSGDTFRRFQVLRGSGRIEGVLMPGNLVLITTLLGTPYLPDLRGKILFIEDISETPFRFDRMLFHLRNAGLLGNLKGLLVGDFGWVGDEGEYESQRRSILEATRGTDYPILVNLPYGHGRDRLTLPVGAPVSVEISEQPSIVLESVESGARA